MFDKSAWSKTYNHERREWYKEHGICNQCGARPAEIDRTLCAECQKLQKARQLRYDPGRLMSTEKRREIRAKRYAAGLCADCGKRPHRVGRKTCEICAKKKRDRDMDRRVRRRLDKYVEAERRRLDELRRISRERKTHTK